MLIVMVVEREFLLSMGWIVRVIEVEHDGRRRLRVAGDEVRHQRLGEPIEVLPVHAVFKSRGRLAHSQGPALEPVGGVPRPA